MGRPLLAADVVARAAGALARGPLCEACLGRLAARVETGLANEERGRLLREAVGAAAALPEACSVCEGLLAEIPAFAELALEALAPFELATFLVGTKVDEGVAERERELVEAVGAGETSEALNSNLNREIGKLVAARRPELAVDFKDPQVTVVVDTRFDIARLTHGGLFLYGRYRKNERGIPQTIWLCNRCRGRGCVDCNNHGKMYPTSVQETIAGPALEASGATEAFFHGAGREDVDARCLGTGRPFVLELKDPRRRTFDLAAIERAVADESKGAVEAIGLRIAHKKEVAQVKEFRGTKTYRAAVALAAPVPHETFIKGIGLLRDAPVIQRTPSRVEHRRADKLRERRVLDVEVEAFTGTTATLRIRGDAGLYIKELVSGDEGRTKPSVAELIGVAARVTDLDVIAVEHETKAEE